ncbi:CerR family C-terminal domain-containing protein [Granulicella arctica]|uniref:CerR family C-terminal domain-containing protein n=1 Tax=Granulicella arctica TaxID=940613 RepID=UPI0021DFEBE0|nr:CerR family C-terminal domain-containing protein [Granulicella arctica]
MNERGRTTHAKLLDVATGLFSERGFDGVSTREIANAAGTTLPSIAHHFGSKQGLYLAVFSSISEEMERQLSPVLAAATDALRDISMSHARALEVLQDLLRVHAKVLLLNRADWMALVVHEQLYPTEAQHSLSDFVEKRLMKTACRLIGILRSLPPAGQAVKLQAFMLVGRVLAFRAVRRSALGIMGWKSFTPSVVEAILVGLRDEVDAIFQSR